jgi:DUF1680 family protein
MCDHGQRKITRRSLLEQSMGVAAGMALSAWTPSLFAEAVSATTGPWRRDSYGTSRRAAQLATLDTVKLQDGPFRTAMDNDQVYLLSLEPDRFLYYFRTTAGLKAKAIAYGGWEQKVGRMLGHYLSACSMYARATGDPLFLQRQNYIVGELAECQRANGDGYVGGVTDARRIFTEIGHGNIYIDKQGRLNGVHAPWYMLHKMIAGLRDAYVYGQNDQALVVLTGFSDWAWKLTDPLSPADMQKMLEDEHGGVNEIFADMYAITGREKYLTLSRRFNRTSVLEPLTRGVDDLDGLHANTQIPTVLGLYRQYEVTGDAAARRGGEFFWQIVTQGRSYVIGGDSDKEHFYRKGKMGENLSVATAETCNSYNMVKLTDRLFAGTPREEFAAYSERVLWNDILASLDKTTPGMTYYMSLKPGHFKTFSKPYDSFWCCVGTGMENHAKYGESIYFHSLDELWINQFIASEISWPAKKMRVAQNTRFPDEQSSEWKISCERPVKATLYLRRPRWAGEAFNIKVNGKSTAGSEPGSYVKMHRTWRNGDVITAQLPMHLHVEAMHDDPSLKAVLYGPIVLAGLVGREGMPDAAPYAGGDQLEFKAVPDPPVPSLALTGEDLSGCFQQTAPLEFTGKTSGSDRLIRFVPLASVTHDRYSVYWKTT